MRKGKIALLGLGMQGKAALHDLVLSEASPHVIVIDSRSDLEADIHEFPSSKVSHRILDAGDEEALTALFKEVDLVVEALPAAYALSTGRLAARTGVHLVSSMYYLDPDESDPERIAENKIQIEGLDATARETGAVILSEFGLDPGIDLVIGSKALSELDSVLEFHSYGAGFPSSNAMNNPLHYKFSWSVIGVMLGYRRPAFVIEDGVIREIEATRIFEPENIHRLHLPDFNAPLECYANGNAVRYAELFGLLGTVQNMGRYACRLPGHCAFWDVLVKSGFLESEPIQVGDAVVMPVEFTTALLQSQEQFQYSPNEQDVTLIRIDVRGLVNDERKRIVYQLIDYRDLKTGFTSMQRTVGFTMSHGAQLILGGKVVTPGLLTPLDVSYDLLLPGLEKHGMNVTREELSWV